MILRCRGWLHTVYFTAHSRMCRIAGPPSYIAGCTLPTSWLECNTCCALGLHSMHQKGIIWLSCHHDNCRGYHGIHRDNHRDRHRGNHHGSYHGNHRDNHRDRHRGNHNDDSLTACMDWQQLKRLSGASPCLEKDMLPALLVGTEPSPQ